MCKRLLCLISFIVMLILAGNVSADLVLHLPCENAENPIDASDNPTTVVVHGLLNSIVAKIDKGLEFDGNAANRLEVEHAAKLEGMSALTIAAWARPRNLTNVPGMSIVSKRVGTNNADSSIQDNMCMHGSMAMQMRSCLRQSFKMIPGITSLAYLMGKAMPARS